MSTTAKALYRHIVGSKIDGERAIARVARAVGRAESAVRDWLRGKAAMPADAVGAVCSVLGRAFAEDVIAARANGWVVAEVPRGEVLPGDVRASSARVTVATGRMTETIERALADGVITDA